MGRATRQSSLISHPGAKFFVKCGEETKKNRKCEPAPFRAWGTGLGATGRRLCKQALRFALIVLPTAAQGFALSLLQSREKLTTYGEK